MPAEYRLQIMSYQVESVYVHTLCTNTACHCDGSLSTSVCSRTIPTQTGLDTGVCALLVACGTSIKLMWLEAKFVAINGAV